VKAEIVNAPWYSQGLTKEAESALELLDGTWSEACNKFAVAVQTRSSSHRGEPKGIQSFLNEVLTDRFLDAGWDCSDSRFRLNSTWVRVTFRHQMSLGSDFLDAIRLTALDDVEQCLLLAAGLDFLKIISPRDATVLCSFEKIAAQLSRLNGAISTPILIGELTPKSSLGKEVSKLVYGQRLIGRG
jgi:hypothetical protein